ncbi:unnamed protein product, partial [Mesorhabditis spiculigera]
MTRGNQRDLARAKNLKKQQEQAKRKGTAEKGANAGASLDTRMNRDADVMRKKQELAAQKKAEEEAAKQGSTTKVAKIDPLAL